MKNVAENLCQLVGKTPLLALNRYVPGSNGRLLAKLETFNPGSSIKDRIALAMIETAEKDGQLKEGYTIIEPTSGNTGIGLAWVAMVKGYRIIISMPESMSMERRKILRNLGAELVLTPAQEGMQGAINQAHFLMKKIPNSFMPQQFLNPANPEIHYKTTGPEIWEDTEGCVDVFIAGVGTGGTVSGVGRFLKEKNPSIRIVAVEPEESAVLSGESAGPHMIQGIGAGFIPDIYNSKVVDEVVKIGSQDAIDAARELSKTEGILAGISSGANILVAKRIFERDREKNVVTILPDTGERYISTLLFYND